VWRRLDRLKLQNRIIDVVFELATRWSEPETGDLDGPLLVKVVLDRKRQSTPSFLAPALVMQ
jgi:hypothetical protein